MSKEFKSLDEQIEILQSKGLIIDDIEQARNVLLRENYFFINGYRMTLMKSPKDRNFVIGATFRELYSVFLFDRYFRNILFKNILIIENNLKSIVSYQLSKKYGYKDKEYLNPKNFTEDTSKIRKVRDLLDKMKRQIRINGSQHTATSHYLVNYGYIPLWVLVKVLSFGIISDLYTVLKTDDKLAIADIYGISVRNLDDYLPILSNYRNLCAHEDILYEHRTEKPIMDNEYHLKLGIPKMDDEYIYGKNDAFSVIIMMKYLLSEDDFRMALREIEYEIENLRGKVSSIPIEKVLDRMGFPTNYMDIMNM